MLFPPARPGEERGGREGKRAPPDPAFSPTPIPGLHAPSCPALCPASVRRVLLFPGASLRPWPPRTHPPTLAVPVVSSLHSGSLPPKGRVVRHALVALRRLTPPPAARDYISRRALRLLCGQLTVLVTCSESGREGGPHRLLELVLAPGPPPCGLELLPAGPGSPPKSVPSPECPKCGWGELSSKSAIPIRGLEIGSLAAWLSHLVSSLRIVRGFGWRRRRGDCPGPLLISDQAEPKCPRNLKSFSTSLF